MIGRHVRTFATVLAAIGGLAFGAADANAATVDSQLNVNIVTEFSKTKAVGIGTVSSAKKACLDNRKVSLIINYTDGKKVFDVGRTGKNGGWMVIGPLSDFDSYESIDLKLAARKAGKVKCGGDKVALT